MKEKVTILSKLTQVFTLIRLYLFVGLYLFAYELPKISRNQLVQDKYCINTIGLEPSKCLKLEQLGPEYDDIKNKVYIHTTTFFNYDALITVPFGMIIAFLVGYWIDKYPSHLRYLLVTPAFGGIFCAASDLLNAVYFNAHEYHILWKSFFYVVSGTITTILTGAYAYILRRTKPQHRVARYAIYEMFTTIAQITASAVGGKLLTVTSFMAIDQQRNFRLVFLTTLITYLITFLCGLIFLFNAEERPIDDHDADQPVTTVKEKVKVNNDENANQNHFIVILAEVFRPSTITNMVKAILRRRPHKHRAILLHLTFGMTIALVGHLSESVIGLQFAQKVYHWNSSYYSYIYALMTIIPALVNTLVPVILSLKLLVFDSTLCIIGSISLIISLAIKGGILEPFAYYISSLAGIFSGLLIIVKRSIVSRIIDKNEAGQVFSLIAGIEVLIPLVLSLFYTTLFNLTIQYAPGTAHQIVSLLAFYPYILSLWLGLNVYKWDPAAAKFLEERKKKLGPNCTKI